jgi:ABC-2 type transport system ATP-binding protein
MDTPILQADRLTKRFHDVTAVDSISLHIDEGEILGLLGPNGAGKTTIIHMLLGLTLPTSGTIRIFGMDLQKHRSRIVQDVNFSSTYTSMPNSLTVRECLMVFARLYRVKNRKERVREVMEMFEIADMARKPVRNLSTGQQTRLNLAKALINEPRLLFLDEPTASLDPDIADKTRRLLKSVKESRRMSILYTSHNMKEMEEVPDRLIFLNKGRILAEGKPDEVVKRFQGKDLEDVFLRVAREGQT